MRKPNKDAKIWDSWASDKDEEEDVLVTVKKMHVTDPKTKSKRKNKKRHNNSNRSQCISSDSGSIHEERVHSC